MRRNSTESQWLEKLSPTVPICPFVVDRHNAYACMTSAPPELCLPAATYPTHGFARSRGAEKLAFVVPRALRLLPATSMRGRQKTPDRGR